MLENEHDDEFLRLNAHNTRFFRGLIQWKKMTHFFLFVNVNLINAFCKITYLMYC